jgi:hypothetical protein
MMPRVALNSISFSPPTPFPSPACRRILLLLLLHAVPTSTDNTFGCVPKQQRADGTNTSCKFPWSKDWSSHGTHTSGTIGAQRNNRGIVGVSAEGAQLFQ